MTSKFEKDVRKALIDKDMTMTSLAEQLGIVTSYAYELITGSRKSIDQIKRICQILGLKEGDYAEQNDSDTDCQTDASQ